ncbi:hypothetical protein PAHAL_4G279100 [Panicum hallii]|jgi:hypothetical protein|uniref:RING-type E3 ubiquitin transferase n=1 Tax=Panicum hallii TaxID=206008 RepID=A0A2S3HKN4_9POAL|nr:E3 ubiquitin-protein ligase Os03g0188200-like [Panicum hallii]PAN25145.1 hypothetical protein PAHAL_4G279100 [Panicum hallii]
MALQTGDEIFLLMVVPLIALFFLACLCSVCLRREVRANGQGHPPPRNEERLRAPVVLAHFPYAARARAAAASEPPPVCAICLDELRQGQLCSEVPACRHIFHEGCIRAWARKKNTCPLCRARVVLPRAAYGIAAADDMV